MYEFIGSTLVPSEVLENDAIINQAYDNLRVAYLPVENRNDREKDKPFAIVDQYAGYVIRELSESEAKSLNWIQKWLYDNDSERHGADVLYQNMLDRNAKVKEIAEKAIQEETREKLEKVHAIASSRLHTYKIDGVKIGVDAPYLGLNEPKE
ncbi:hypothetical protein FDG92_gp22 [Arthrobacter phage Jasmine]|uniref:Uncharacterized protein n=1 Tax=Arthrobacter phage Jasmine TaxID=1772302 RepID=A0A0U4B3L1_9CAUD|nr:hypothetical protein FDG92_gp22 [Arthrobacter phage Jasmine]ALY09294.1 hypothetical protein JASMINE_23 [Arthrobacter phage Jasmine]